MSLTRHSRFLTLATIAAVALAAVPAFADTKALYNKVIDQTSNALVTVKFVLKLQGAGGPQEIEREFTALMIEKGGLVLCSSVQLGTSRLFRRQGASVTPTDIKILIGDDTEGVEAKLLTNDPELDLSWVQIKKPDEKGYKSLDLAKSKMAVLGDRMFSVKRMDKFFDRALVVNEGYLGGVTKKPRELLIPTSSLEFGQANIGMPVFGDDGSIVGISVLQSADPEDIEGGARPAAEVLILPVAEVNKATEKAKTVTPEEEEEEEDSDATSKPAADAAKAAPAKPDKKADEEEEEEEEEE